jgi:hypothetical protein
LQSRRRRRRRSYELLQYYQAFFFFPAHGCYKQELRIIVVIAGEKAVCAATAVPDKRNRASEKAMKKKKINKD